MDQEILNSYSKLNDLNVSRETFLDFENYISMINEKNKEINIISQKTSSKKSIIERHIIDSAQIIDFVDFNFNTTTDLGSGAGMPGIVVAIILKNMKNSMNVHLYEKSYHKSRFLKEVSEKLNLNTKVFQKNIFEIKNLETGTIMSRAFKPMPVVLDLVYENFSKYKNLIFFMGKGKAMLGRTSNEAKEYGFDINPTLNESYKSIFHTDEIIADQLIIQDLSINKNSNKQALQLLIKLGLDPKASITALEKLETSKFVVESSPINAEDLAISGIKFEAEDLEDNYQPVTIKESNQTYRSYHEGLQNQIKKLETAFDEASESNKVFLTNNEDFEEIKTLARFQLINHELTRGNIKKAIYYSLICKRTHPDNYFINYALVRGFYALSAYSNSKKWSKALGTLKKHYQVTVSKLQVHQN